jgi:hypothetical protein
MFRSTSLPNLASVQARFLNKPVSRVESVSHGAAGSAVAQDSGASSASVKPGEASSDQSPVRKPPPGYSNFLFCCKQWTCYSTEPLANGEVEKYTIVNNPDNNKKITSRYYSVVSGGYGQPLIMAEPDLAIPLPQNTAVVYATTGKPMLDLKEKIAGIIVTDAQGEAILRTSLTKAADNKDKIKLSDDGVLEFNGTKYYLYGIFDKDKNRIFGFDGFFSAEDPGKNAEGKRIFEYLELDGVRGFKSRKNI